MSKRTREEAEDFVHNTLGLPTLAERKRMAVPTINVNLKPCDCGRTGTHVCQSEPKPVSIPCPIPRTVEMTVRLGECDRGCHQREAGHWAGCSGEPIRVICTIGGETWEGSEVTEAAVVEMDSIGRILDAQEDGMKGLAARLVAACSERWASVKSVLLNAPFEHAPGRVADAGVVLTTQRDAVFSALADMARAEEAARVAQVSFDKHEIESWGIGHAVNPAERHSACCLTAYVEHLIEQVGAP